MPAQMSSMMAPILTASLTQTDTENSFSAREGQLASRPRLLLLHGDTTAAKAMQQILHPLCESIQIAPTWELARAHLLEKSWDIFLVHLAGELSCNQNSGLEALRYAQGSGLLLARIALLDQMDGKLLTALIPLELHALLLAPHSALVLRETMERCYVTLVHQRQQERTTAGMREQILQLKRNQKEMLAEKEHLEHSVMEALLSALAVRETDCVLHGLRVQAYASYFARQVQYPESLRPHLERAALLHDIGKIGLSDSLLFRPGVFTAAEVERMQSHTTVGERILHGIHFLQPAAQIVRHHHERFDGLGFPDGLQGEKIPVGARIFSIVDAMDALTSERPYRPAQSFEKAQQEIERCAGTHFDPRLTVAYMQISPATWQQIRWQVEQAYATRQPLLMPTATTRR